MRIFDSKYLRHATLIIIATLCVVSCKKENKLVTLTGQIIHPTTDRAWLTVNDSTLSSKLDEAGNFKFELMISVANKYRLDHGGWTYVFLTPGSKLHITLDAKEFDNSISYSGNNLEENEYLKKRILIKEKLEDNRFNIPNMNQNEFDSVINCTLDLWKESLLKLPRIDCDEYAIFKNDEIEELNELNVLLAAYYDGLKKLTPGESAIDFKAIDIHGVEYSLKDFNNKVVCIDIWASWCTACLKEMPYFEKLVTKYENHDIEFLGISVDDKEEVWRELLDERELTSLQLWAQGGRQSEFFENYKLNDLPAYIVIDRNGKIVNVRAPRPSENLEDVIIKALSIKLN